MIDEGAGLNAVQQVALLGLRLRALDGASDAPLLGDDHSVAIARAMGLDLGKPALPRAVVLVHAVRARTLDDTVRRFVAVHPDAVVLDVGCGLDPRRARCAPPAGVDWYDVDFPEVTSLRERFVPDPGHLVGTDVTTPGWLDAVPADRPVIVVTDGLQALLSGPSFIALARAVTGHFRSGGEFAFNAYSRLALRNGRRARGALAMPVAGEGIDDPREPESWDAGLTLVEELSMSRAPQVARFPPLLRAMARITARSTRLARTGDRVVRYRFAPGAGHR